MVFSRLSREGFLIAGFGESGKARVSFGNFARGNDMALDHLGRIVAVGEVPGAKGFEFGVADCSRTASRTRRSAAPARRPHRCRPRTTARRRSRSNRTARSS